MNKRNTIITVSAALLFSVPAMAQDSGQEERERQIEREIREVEREVEHEVMDIEVEMREAETRLAEATRRIAELSTRRLPPVAITCTGSFRSRAITRLSPSRNSDSP